MEDFRNTQDYINLKSKLLDYLGRQDYSEAKLLEKVCNLKKNYPQTIRYRYYTQKNVLLVIDDLKELGLINEIRFLENMIYSSLRSNYGIRRVKQKMYRHKYKKENIEHVLRQYEEDKPQRDLSKIISTTQRRKETLQRKYKDESDYTLERRLFQFLAQKGFEYDEISTILKELEN